MLDNFHFLRPLWLLLILVLPLIIAAFRHVRPGDSGWSRFIPARLLSPVIRHDGTSGTARPSPVVPAALAVTLIAVALAGPAWREAPVPLKQPGDSLVIALDLSLSMLATDVEPNRLTRAKRKIRDILAAREGSLTGLLVYAGDAHVVTPLTDDRRTIEAMLDVLDPVIMPATGNRADLAIRRARDLLDQGAPGDGRILLITDTINGRYQDAIRESLAGTDYTLSTLVVGTEAGGPIPLARRGFIRENGDIVITRAEPEQLAELARSTGGQSHQLTLDGTDIRALDLATRDSNEWRNTGDNRTVRRWQDDGYWLLWLALPLILIGWRRGALTLVALALLPVWPQPAQAISWDALWQREDQRAPELIRSNPEQAARQLEDPAWRGSALYRSGEFASAAEAFARAKGPRASYNRGNALARAGKLEEALAAYDRALAQAPELEDARHNRKIVEDLLRQQKQQNGGKGGKDSRQQKNGQPGSDQSNSGNSQQQGQNRGKQAQGNPQQDPGSTSEQSGRSGKQQTEQQTEQQPRQQAEQQPEQQTEQQSGSLASAPASQAEGQGRKPAPITETPLTQSQEQWLRRVPDNPGGLLQRKFLQQYQERQIPSDEGDIPW